MPTGRPGDGSRGWIDGREGVARDEKGSLKTRLFYSLRPNGQSTEQTRIRVDCESRDLTTRAV